MARCKTTGEKNDLTVNGVKSMLPMKMRTDKVILSAVEGPMTKKLQHFVMGLMIATIVYFPQP